MCGRGFQLASPASPSMHRHFVRSVFCADAPPAAVLDALATWRLRIPVIRRLMLMLTCVAAQRALPACVRLCRPTGRGVEGPCRCRRPCHHCGWPEAGRPGQSGERMFSGLLRLPSALGPATHQPFFGHGSAGQSGWACCCRASQLTPSQGRARSSQPPQLGHAALYATVGRLSCRSIGFRISRRAAGSCLAPVGAPAAAAGRTIGVLP